ncbi:twin-arginine translocase subunit TatC [Thermocladium modestius]|uniref:Sec-independent protein translocase protein TatC n=1 Tax=Thermocladium modestius TaxID=62609 RepID=A0A830GZ99_9CREN|nr:twin-arginine translocase subunit TatC [Thermocladium modestius]GGP22169.1 twin-arginine translocase subunit TatC [Thermocladium modestius]
MSGEELLSHLAELTRRLRRALLAVALAFIFSFAFGVRMVKVGGDPLLPVPYPSIDHSISTMLVSRFVESLLPSQVKLISIGVFDPLYASIEVSLLLSAAVALPVVMWELWGFVAPGLYPHERKAVKAAIIPSIALFAAGALFAYAVIVPTMLKFFLLFDESLGVEPTLSIKSFIGTVVSFMAAMGIGFQLPLVMAGLTKVGAVSAEAWRRNWRWGVLASFVFALIVSPGATGGIIETTIGLSLSALYVVGIAVAKAVEPRRRQNL